MRSGARPGLVLLFVLIGNMAFTQQLRLGNQPYTVEKSAVLELVSTNQGLLFPRITDTALSNALSPPDGMVIYFTVTKQLLIRANGYWQALASTSALTNYWSVNGNATGAVKKLGTTDNYDLTFITNNTEKMRLTNTGRVGINTNAPSTLVHIKTGVTDDGGLRMENLTSSSAVTTGAAVLGVDATGKVVRAKRPLYYSGGIGGTATTEDVTKIWIAEVANAATGIQTITIPANVAFATILSIQLTAKGGSSIATAPIAMVTSNTTSSIVIRVLESKNTGVLIGGNVEGLEAHTDTNTKIYIRVEGN
jgi:hypothetical protein